MLFKKLPSWIKALLFSHEFLWFHLLDSICSACLPARLKSPPLPCSSPDVDSQRVIALPFCLPFDKLNGLSFPQPHYRAYFPAH